MLVFKFLCLLDTEETGGWDWQNGKDPGQPEQLAFYFAFCTG